MNKYTMNTGSALRLLSRLYDCLCRAYPDQQFTIDTGIREMSLDSDDGAIVKFEKDFFEDNQWKVTVGNASIVSTVHHLVMHDHVPFQLPQAPASTDNSSFKIKIPGLGIDISL